MYESMQYLKYVVNRYLEAGWPPRKVSLDQTKMFGCPIRTRSGRVGTRKPEPGHGPLGSRESMQRTIDYLWAMYRDVKEGFAAGLSADAAVGAVRLRPEFRLPVHTQSRCWSCCVAVEHR